MAHTVILPYIAWLVFLAGLVTASAFDLKQRRIPNLLCLLLFFAGCLARALAGGWVALAWGVAAAVLALVLLLYPFARGWLGGGDVKLSAAIGSWLGPLQLLEMLLYAAVAGGLLSLIYILRSPRQVREEIVQNIKTAAIMQEVPQVSARPKRLSPPLAIGLSLGALLTLLLRANKLMSWELFF
jgi:prepilin peptidase CpaA